MPTPEFVLKLRQRIGHDLLFLPGVCGIVFNAAGEILLQRRSDTGKWSLLGGIAEPGEEMADAVVRELLEETGLHVRVQRITGVYITPVVHYPNGDLAQYVITAFRCEPISGTAHVADDESLEVRYFPLDQLPDLRPDHHARIQHALADGPAYFVPEKQ